MLEYPSYNELNKTFKNEMSSVLGEENLKTIYQAHPDVVTFIFNNATRVEAFLNFLKYTGNPEEDFARATRCYFYEYCYVIYNQNTLPEWLQSMNFNVTSENLMQTPEDIESFQNLSNKTIFTDKYNGRAINLLGIENIQKFEQETSFFSTSEEKFNHLNLTSTRNTLGRLVSYFDRSKNRRCAHTYKDFKDIIAEYIEEMRPILATKLDYSVIEGNFREEYPYLFLPKDAPQQLQNDFYFSPYKIDFYYLGSHLDYLPYLKNTHLDRLLDDPRVNLCHTNEEKGHWDYFIKFYITNYGQDTFLELIRKYGEALSLIKIGTPQIIIDNQETIAKSIRTIIYNALAENPDVSMKHFVDQNTTEFMNEYPDIFIKYEDIPLEGKEKDKFYDSFYKRTLNLEYLGKHPELIPILKDKNLKIILANCRETDTDDKVTFLGLLDFIDNLSFLKIVVKYGEYLEAVKFELTSSFMYKNPSFEGLCKEIERCIGIACRYGDFYYNPETAPLFLKEQNPDLFLPEDAPLELYNSFYNDVPGFNFDFISKHPKYLPYLKDKSLVGAFYNNSTFSNKKELRKFFSLIDTNSALKLITQKPSTLEQMINDGKSDIVYIWYEKTGHKFIPDYIVMITFPTDEIDSFLANSKVWSNLQKLTSYTDTMEHKDALLKMAYIFGIFAGDKKGYEQLIKLLTGIPRYIPNTESADIALIDIAGAQSHTALYRKLNRCLLREGFPLDKEKPIMSQIYRQNRDNSYTLTFNPQDYPASTALIRNFFRIISYKYLMTPHKTHRLFSGFALKYDEDFKNFLLDNLEEILSDNEHASQLANVQKRFKEIKVINSNRVLTWNLAVGYCLENQYDNVEIGNDAAAEIASIAGYSPSDFATLQQIYNYGKQRTFSSIPRIQGKEDSYSYEILRLDDPLALAIGTLTDCCQEIGNIAELCVEHSMVDKNGRIFVVRDEEGNIVSQSWVWRNNNVLCFDNIEIPDKAFKRATSAKGGTFQNRDIFTDKIFDIYKKAAKEFILEDVTTMHELVVQGIITEEQYEENRLKKVTVGIGYNDIAESIQRNANIVESPVIHPLPFEAPVPLKRCLWTSDSMIQYLMEGIGKSVSIASTTYSLYSDPFIIYDNETFFPKNYLQLQKLEMSMENRPYFLTELKHQEYPNLNSLASNYGLNPLYTKILMNPNLAIIYEETDKIRVIDLLYNTKIEQGKMDITDAILIQIKLAFDQLSISKEIDTSLLSLEQQSMYKKAMAITTERILEEKGIKSFK